MDAEEAAVRREAVSKWAPGSRSLRLRGAPERVWEAIEYGGLAFAITGVGLCVRPRNGGAWGMGFMDPGIAGVPEVGGFYLLGRGDGDTELAARWYDARVADLVGGLVARLDSLGFVERAAAVESGALGQVVDVALATFETDEAPWRRIPASQGQDIARMWSEGVSAKKIGDNVGVSADRVHNIVARLRRDYGDDVAPLRNPKVAKLVRSREKNE